MPSLLQEFLSPSRASLKICGVTSSSDANELAARGVHALGINFWPQSKRFCAPETASGFLPALKNRLLRVGVFVNADPALPRRLLAEDQIDLAQFHGDESLSYCESFREDGLPFLKAVGVPKGGVARTAMMEALDYSRQALLFDAAAPGIYGGTGETIDWEDVAWFVSNNSSTSVLLAGGINPGNASDALATVRPAAIDIASGAESASGLKDFAKVDALLAAVQAHNG